MSASFTSQTIAQIELHQSAEKYGVNRVHNVDAATPTVITLPKHLDESCSLTSHEVWCDLTELRQDQADYIQVPVEGPYKPEHYRY